VTVRTERNWRTGAVLPEDNIEGIAQVFYPDAGGERERAALRHALSEDQRRRREAPASNIPDPGLCLGRDAEIARLAGALMTSSGGATVLLLGGPGYGKTTLTKKVGLHLDVISHFGARRWFVELDTVHTADGILAEVAASVGMERTAQRPAVLRQLGEKPGLVVLDNLETPWRDDRRAVEALLRELAAIPGLAVMASVRGEESVGGPHWSEQIWLEILPADIARVLFLSVAGRIREDDPDLEFFLAELGGIPLAIRLVANRASTHGTLAPLRRQWERHGASLAAEPDGEIGRRDSLVASIEFSLESRRFREEGKRLFQLLGQLPAGLLSKDCDALLGDDAFDAVDQMRAVGLLRDREGRADLLPPVRDVARRGHPPLGPDAAAWISHYLALAKEEGNRVGKDGGGSAITRLQLEMANIAAAILASAATLEDRTAALGLVEGLRNAMRYGALSAAGELEILARQCVSSGDWRGEAGCLSGLADIARIQSRNDEARGLYEDARERYVRVGELSGEAGCLWGLAEIARMQARYDEARGLYENARERCVRAGGLSGEAYCLEGLATIARMQDRSDEARAFYENARERYVRAGGLSGEADCLRGLAKIARMQHRNDEAHALYEEARERYARAGGVIGEADCLFGVAEVEEAMGAHDAACSLYAEAEALFHKAQQMDWVRWIAWKRRALGCPQD
jgi:tetratricopeptide (TPR) repeat protein